MIRKELNEFKSTEMDVHEESRQFTRLVDIAFSHILLVDISERYIATLMNCTVCNACVHYIIARIHSFPQQILLNFGVQFAQFYGSPQHPIWE